MIRENERCYLNFPVFVETCVLICGLFWRTLHASNKNMHSYSLGRIFLRFHLCSCDLWFHLTLFFVWMTSLGKRVIEVPHNYYIGVNNDIAYSGIYLWNWKHLFGVYRFRFMRCWIVTLVIIKWPWLLLTSFC